MKQPDSFQRALVALHQTLARCQIALSDDTARLARINEIRIDGHVTQLFVDLDRQQILWQMALSSQAIINLKALLFVSEGKDRTL